MDVRRISHSPSAGTVVDVVPNQHIDVTAPCGCQRVTAAYDNASVILATYPCERHASDLLT